MKKVGILGGTFNPPHLGHLIMANEAYHSEGLDEVRFMPNFIAPHKEVDGANATQRLEMTRLAIDGHAEFRVEEFEIQTGGVSYTYDTMLELMKREPDTEFYFIIGGDSISDLSSWHRIEELAELVHFIGISRPGFENKSPYSVRMIDSPEMHLSSTMLRKRMAQNRTISFLVPEKVEAFIRKERLYGPERNVAEGEETPS